MGVFTFGDCQNYYASQTDLVKYGLDKNSRITVDITYKDTDTKKTKNVVLYIGKKDSDQKNYYVQMKICRASSSMPLAAPIANVDGIPYMDGGLADSIPIEYAL